MTQMNTSHLTNNESGEGTQSSCWDPFPLHFEKVCLSFEKMHITDFSNNFNTLYSS